MDKATQKSIEWQKANYPMAIGGDAFADMVDSYNVNPAFVAGYKEAEKDIWDRIEKYLKTRHHTDYATVGWILDNLEYYKQKIMEDKAELAWKIQGQIKEETK